ncbi:MAG: histidine phosphatase family protein [Shimia sp.]
MLRHGQTYWNAEGRMQGKLNSSLTPTGIAQAEAQGRILDSLDLTGFSAIMSPQGRVVQTAGIAVAPLVRKIRTDDRLREIGVGDWAGQLRADFDLPASISRGDESLELYDAAPGGEGLKALASRCADFLRSLEGPTILITHGITGHMLRTLWLGNDPATVGNLPGGQGVVFRLSDKGHEVLTDPA